MAMAERYTIFSKDSASRYRCLFPIPDPDGPIDCCIPGRCPAWIEELDDAGEPTGRGRCGMVPARIERAPA